MALNLDAKFEGKLTCALKTDMRNLENFHQSMFESLKTWIFIGSFYPKQKLQFIGELYVTTMKNDAKFEEDLTGHFKSDMRNLTNFDPSTQKSQRFTF